MPKNGYQSITVKETVYSNFFQKYDAIKDDLRILGITSFAGFISFLLNKIINDPKAWNAIVETMDQDHKNILDKIKVL